MNQQDTARWGRMTMLKVRRLLLSVFMLSNMKKAEMLFILLCFTRSFTETDFLRSRRASSRASSQNSPQFNWSSTPPAEDDEEGQLMDLRSSSLPMALKRAVRYETYLCPMVYLIKKFSILDPFWIFFFTTLSQISLLYTTCWSYHFKYDSI